MAVAAASTAVNVVGTIQSAKAQTKAINHANDVKQAEIDKAATAEINDRLRAARREQGRIMVAAGQSGLSLESGGVESLLLDSAMQAELSNDRSLANKESRKLATAAEAQSLIPSRPTALGAGLQIGMSAAKGYMNSSTAQSQAQRKGD